MNESRTLLCNPTLQVPLLGGAEIPQSRRRCDIFTAANYPPSGRIQYEGGSLSDCAVRVDYSLDDGATWAVFIPPAGTVNTGVTVMGDWQVLPAAAASQADILLRCVAVGGALIAVSIFYVELQLHA